MRISDWSSDVCSSDLDPSRVGTAEAELTAMIQASGLPEADKLKYQAQLRQGLATSAVSASILANPSGAKAALQGGRWDTYLDADKKAALLASADVEIRQRATEYRQRQAEENQIGRAHV